MRFLIVSAVLACAYAAPTYLLTPVIYTGLPAVHVPALTPVAYAAVVPTISPGDVEAAAIDAQVKLNDLAIAEADRARALVDQKSETLNDGQAKETGDKAVRSDKDMRALYILTEAQINGAVEGSTSILAKNVDGIIRNARFAYEPNDPQEDRHENTPETEVVNPGQAGPTNPGANAQES